MTLMKICINRRKERDETKRREKGPHFPVHAHPTHLRLLWDGWEFLCRAATAENRRTHKEARSWDREQCEDEPETPEVEEESGWGTALKANTGTLATAEDSGGQRELSTGPELESGDRWKKDHPLAPKAVFAQGKKQNQKPKCLWHRRFIYNRPLCSVLAAAPPEHWGKV